MPAAPSPTVSPVAAAAESVRQWAGANDHGGKLPKQLFRPASPLTLAIEIDACDGEPSECISRLDLPDAAAFEAWLTDNVGELPGLDVSTTIESCTDDCCTFANLGREAAKEGGMVPHELLELRAVCFDVDQHTVLGVRRMKFVEW